MGVHDHHRERLRQSFCEIGLKGKTEHQALELLLTYIIPRRDVNPIAHELIGRFGSLAGVFDADIEDLTKINYVTEYGAVLLKLIPEMSAMYNESKFSSKPKLDTFEKIKEYMVPKLAFEKNEVFYVLCFDAQFRLIRSILHSEGIHEKANISIRTLVNDVIKTGACQVVLVHNHLSGTTVPSLADVDATKKIIDALKPLDIKVLDHLIIAGNNCFNIANLEQVLYPQSE